MTNRLEYGGTYGFICTRGWTYVAATSSTGFGCLTVGFSTLLSTERGNFVGICHGGHTRPMQVEGACLRDSIPILS